MGILTASSGAGDVPPTPVSDPSSSPAPEVRPDIEQLLMPALTLTWQSSPHKFEFFVGANGKMSGKFTINKNKATQTIEVPLPEGITVDAIRSAWEAQQGAWVQLAAGEEIKGFGDHEIKTYVGVRFIHIPGKGAIIWHIFHVNGDHPFDQCVFNSGFDPAKLVKEKPTA